jgi:hypothetical protein
MIPYLGCHAAREMLQPFVDLELPMADQVALESHLRWCTTCRARVEDMRLIGAALRRGSDAVGMASEDATALAAGQANLLIRIGAERDHAFPAWFRGLFTDGRYLWPAAGATVSLLTCLLAVTGVNRVAQAELPDSMADRIAALANPGSDRNPVQLDALMLAPRALQETPALDSIPEDEALFALAAVITREGRVASYELLQSVRARVLRRWTAAHSDDVSALLDAVKRARFSPARTPEGAVAVNMVWVLARTTVKAPFATHDVIPRVAPEERRPLTGGLAQPALRPARS